jgi:hypothetical protein
MPLAKKYCIEKLCPWRQKNVLLIDFALGGKKCFIDPLCPWRRKMLY